MARREISEYLIYRWRFVIGYTLVGLLLASLLVFAGLYVPGGLTSFERASAITSAALSLDTLNSFAIIHLPYHLLQAGIFELFGISQFTIKLPSLILGLIAAIGLILLLRRWFPPSIAVLASLIAITTGQFIFIAQSGQAGVLYIFWPVMLLLIGTMVTRGKRFRLFWKVLFAATAALSLYSPLSVYALVAVCITIILHPHLRNIIRRLSKPRIILAASVALILLIPLVYNVTTNPALGLILLGIPTTPPDILQNLNTLVTQYFVFWDPTTTRILAPVFGLGSMLLIVLGFIRLIKTRDTTRSYLLISWIACLIPILVINPLYVTIVYVPAVMLLAAGLTSLIGYWYRLFPFNPYARIAGLIPIIVLVAALIASGVDRYVYGYHYSPTTAAHFSRDLSLLPKDTKNLVVTERELLFYQAVAKYREGLLVSTTEPLEDELNFTATRDARAAADIQTSPSRIITSPFKDDGDRFYLYQKTTQ